MAGMTIIVRTIARLMFPFVVLFGIYIIAHGHLTPGGGFPGGVVLAASVLMLILAYGVEYTHKRVGILHAEVLESAGAVIVVSIGLVGLIFGIYFLQNVFPLGSVGQVFSAGNLGLLYFGVGIKVAAGILLILYAMLLADRGEKG